MSTTNNQGAGILPEGLDGDSLHLWLETNATDTRNDRYIRNLSAEEVSQAETDCARLGIESDDIQEEFSKIKGQFKAKLDERKNSAKILRTQIRTKTKEEVSTLYTFIDKEGLWITEFNASGKMVTDRELTLTEMKKHGLK